MTGVELDKPTEKTFRRRAAALANMLTAAPYRHRQSTWGDVKSSNECGTAACAAGWSLLAAREIVTIAVDVRMTWDPERLGSTYPREEYDSDAEYEAVVARDHTLWREEYDDHAESEGRAWLGLSGDAAQTLFLRTTDVSFSDEVAREVLRRIGDGSLGDWDGGTWEIDFDLSRSELADIADGLGLSV